jgi:hypothetical protein
VEENKNFSSPVACPGEEEGETVWSKNDTILLFLFLFFEKCMKPRRFLENNTNDPRINSKGP